MRVFPFLAVVAVAVLSGCGGTGGAAAVGAPPAGAPAAASAPGSASPSPVVPAVVPEALKFTGTTLDGKAFDATKFAGRPVVLWFWAPWCAVCLGQASTVGDLAKEYDGKVAMVGIAGLDQSAKAMDEFVVEGEVGNVTHLNDKAGVIWRKFGIKEQSVFVMIDRTGKVMQNGYQDTVSLGEWVTYLDKH
jgi:thiol-disulfide isomerase/thioredoxin